VLSIEIVELGRRSDIPEEKLFLEHVLLECVRRFLDLAAISAVVKQSGEDGWISIQVDSVLRISLEQAMSVIVSEHQLQMGTLD
jgi:hypothetical protein